MPSNCAIALPCRRWHQHGAPAPRDPDVAVKVIRSDDTEWSLLNILNEMNNMADASWWGPHCLPASAAFWEPAFDADGGTRVGTTFYVAMP